MDPRRIVALSVLSILATVGFIGFVIGVSKYQECSNELGVWLVAMGTMTMAIALAYASHVETIGMSDRFSWFDSILALFLFGFIIWGTVILTQTSLSQCTETMFTFAEFAVIVAWFVSIIILMAASIKFRDLVTKQQTTTTTKRTSNSNSNGV